MAQPAYPVRVEGHLDEPLSRWLWLVKWALAIPHYIVLAFLWLAFFVLTVIAFFAILFTGRYPRGIFDFNVGVLRWSWRGGVFRDDGPRPDPDPPFTPKDGPGHPAPPQIVYPPKLSPGVGLVKWGVLATPPHPLLRRL